jgi:hypothetical protein
VSVVVVIPSRGRPGRAHRAVRAIRQTARRVDTSVVLAVDADDPELEAYRALRWDPIPYRTEVALVVLEGGETGSLVKATNTVSMRIAGGDPDAIIGNLGDDHLATSHGWDQLIAGALSTPGIAYGDDGLQGEQLPTAPFISARIVLALGWYALPSCRHMFIDNAWRDVGEQTRCLRYIPDVRIEHEHPLAGKAEWDDGYRLANGIETIEHDKRAYHEWRERYMAQDLARVRAVLPEAA